MKVRPVLGQLGLCVLALSLSFASTARAEDVNFGGSYASANDLIAAFAPTPAGPKMRGVPATPIKQEPRGVSLQLLFEFGSSGLADEAKAQLDQLAKAMQHETLLEYAFLIEGHTDAVGPDWYNEKLSKERARSAKTYLVAEQGIAAERIETVGLGERDLINSDDPAAGENRRVRFERRGKIETETN